MTLKIIYPYLKNVYKIHIAACQRAGESSNHNACQKVLVLFANTHFPIMYRFNVSVNCQELPQAGDILHDFKRKKLDVLKAPLGHRASCNSK